MKTILVPVDFSSATDAVVTAAVDLARALRGRIVLLSVIQPPVITSELASPLIGRSRATMEAQRSAEKQLAALEKRITEDWLVTETVCLVGIPVTLIIEQAKHFSADYIVIGTHGHGAIYELLVGSTTHGVLLRAKCPIVIVPAAEREQARPRSARAGEPAAT